MCSVRAVLTELLAALDAREAQDKGKIERTLLEPYAPGQRPVLPENRPYGPMPEVGH